MENEPIEFRANCFGDNSKVVLTWGELVHTGLLHMGILSLEKEPVMVIYGPPENELMLKQTSSILVER
jgi:hypothetical protein